MRDMTTTAETTLLDEAELAAWRGMLLVHRRVTAALDEELEREHGLALGSYEVLLHLSAAPEGSLRMGDLAGKLLISPSGVTRLVDRLARRGLVERTSCPNDRRGTFARLTEEGERRFEEARPTHMRGIREHFLSHLDGDDRERLAAIWERLAAAPAGAGAAPGA